VALLAVAGADAVGVAHADEAELRVCADPDNLPYSDTNGAGFENRIAKLVADDLGAKLTYTWYPQRRGFVRRTLNERVCDVMIGVPTALDLVRTTKPYYRSQYVFVYPAASSHAYASLDDPALTSARIGIQLVGDDLAATPPAHALALRGIVDHVIGYPVYGEHPQGERMIDALGKGEIDVALIWGPQAAYYARRAAKPLTVVPAEAPADLAMFPFEFSISMGVRKNDVTLAQALDDVLARRRSDIDAILDEYGVPRTNSRVASARRESR
jgi:quinoprotein dehydrogenase-associated probable ABC transporter substrate-binding protein